jgi:hypothetical protein
MGQGVRQWQWKVSALASRPSLQRPRAHGARSRAVGSATPTCENQTTLSCRFFFFHFESSNAMNPMVRKTGHESRCEGQPAEAEVSVLSSNCLWPACEQWSSVLAGAPPARFFLSVAGSDGLIEGLYAYSPELVTSSYLLTLSMGRRVGDDCGGGGREPGRLPVWSANTPGSLFWRLVCDPRRQDQFSHAPCSNSALIGCDCSGGTSTRGETRPRSWPQLVLWWHAGTVAPIHPLPPRDCRHSRPAAAVKNLPIQDKITLNRRFAPREATGLALAA